MQCISCESTEVIKKGLVELRTGQVKQRYRCKACGEHFSVLHEDEDSDDDGMFDTSIFRYQRSTQWVKENILDKKRIVITSAQNNTPVDVDFFKSLQTYCTLNGAGLIVIPIKYRTVNNSEDDSVDAYDERVTPFLCENTIEFQKHNLRIYAGLKIQATAENPLSGLDPLSKGWSIVVGHAQFQLKTLPNNENRCADIITTTGAVTIKNYSKTKLGEKANFNHSMSAIVVEFDRDVFHLRNLNYDEKSKSFTDLDITYSRSETKQTYVDALITGDEHVVFRDKNVSNYTYLRKDSLVNVLRPQFIIRHDVLDSYAISHHHQKNIFTKFAKFVSGKGDVKMELDETLKYIIDTTPSFATSIIVQSNHNEHLLRWLNEVDIKNEPWNALVYHELMFKMLKQTSMGESGAEYPDPFKLYAEGVEGTECKLQFVSRAGMKIHDIEVGQHGDKGISGARGSAKSFARFPVKTVVGHSHAPSVEKSCYVVGTSSSLRLEYNTGASSWHHAHVIIHKTGKRQIVFITDHGYRST